jgi:hypothetical protein
MLCVQRGFGHLGGNTGPSALIFLQERSGVTLRGLADTPDGLLLDIRRLFGPKSVLIFSSIRRELILSSINRHPNNGRLEAFLSALKKAKESVKVSDA